MDNKKIQVIFPGVGYHCDKPLLYYGRKVAYEAGYQTFINISYNCPVDRIRGNEEKMKTAVEAMFSQAEQQLREVSWDTYEDILFVSKSIGTVIAAMYVQKHLDREVKHLLYTPLKETFLAFEDVGKIDAMAFIGSEDPWSHVPSVIQQAEALGISIHRYEGANHSLETEDTFRNLEILTDVMDKSKKYLTLFP